MGGDAPPLLSDIAMRMLLAFAAAAGTDRILIGMLGVYEKPGYADHGRQNSLLQYLERRGKALVRGQPRPANEVPRLNYLIDRIERPTYKLLEVASGVPLFEGKFVNPPKEFFVLRGDWTPFTDQDPFSLMFHGSPIRNWHNILTAGFKEGGTGALGFGAQMYGQGVYCSSKFRVVIDYATHANRLPAPLLIDNQHNREGLPLLEALELAPTGPDTGMYIIALCKIAHDENLNTDNHTKIVYGDVRGIIVAKPKDITIVAILLFNGTPKLVSPDGLVLPTAATLNAAYSNSMNSAVRRNEKLLKKLNTPPEGAQS